MNAHAQISNFYEPISSAYKTGDKIPFAYFAGLVYCVKDW